MIVFNALQATLSGGIGRYSYELSREIYLKKITNFKIVIREEDLELFKFADRNDLIIAKGIKDSISRNKYEQFVLPKLIYKKYPNAVIHYPDSMAPFFAKNKVIITIHDLAFKSLKNVFTAKTLIWKNGITKLSVKKATKIISITKFTQMEILKHFPKIDVNKIKVILNGFNDFSKENINENNISKNIKTFKDKEYILTVSTISPRKNIDGLIEAFSYINDNVRGELVIAGAKGWMFEEVFKKVETLNLKSKVHFTNKINEDELKCLYKHANVFVYPSFYEGFGLPPLEAMSFGVPCITSNTASIPEVVGNAAALVLPHDYKKMAEEIEKLIINNQLREQYIKRGKLRLNEFSWEKCAQQTIELYNDIID